MKLPIPITISDATGKTWPFDRLDTFKKFVKEEESFWKEKHNELGLKGLTNSYLNVFSQLASISALTKDLKTMLSSNDESSTKTHITNYQTAQLNPLSTSWIWSGHTFITPWLDSYKVSQLSGDTFIQVLLTKNISYPSLASYDYFKGCILAYEYDLQDESLFTKRTDALKNSFDHLKDTLVSEKNDLVSEITNFKAEAENIKTTYVELMRLKGPAEYWHRRANECRAQGKNWAGLLGATIIIAGFIFVSLMLAWLHAYNTELKLSTLEGAAIFAAIVSLFAFAIKTLSKLTFSSFHLQRDAEEREQLVHLYLALSNENKIDEASRSIILQALFSRTESGLLTGEHSPTMPTVQDVVKLSKSNG
jgi:hypothetical protein